jgi:uncharacterized protein with HEPN domain
MSSRNVHLYLDDISQACQDIIEFTKGMDSAKDFESDRRTMLAVIRSLEVIGEAARQTPKAFRDKHASIPWREMTNFRNVIAHEYFGLDFDIVWDVIKNRIPSLNEQIKLVKSELEG